MTAIRRWMRHAIGRAVAAVFLYLAYGHMDWRALLSTVAAASALPLVLGLVLLAADFLVRAARWWWMLRAFEDSLPLGACVWPFVVSLAVNNTVPFRAGDVYRVTGFRRSLRSPPMRVLGTLVLERLLDLLTLLALFFIGLAGLADGSFPRSFVRAGAAIGAVALGALAVLLVCPEAVRGLFLRGAGLPILSRRGLTPRLTSWADQFFGALLLLRSPLRLAQLLGLSLLAWVLEGSVFALAAAAIRVPCDTFGPWFSLATGTLATLLPSTPGYVGTFDYFAVLGLVGYGATKAGAAAFALLVHALLWLPVTAAGAVYAILRGGGRPSRRRQCSKGGDSCA